VVLIHNIIIVNKLFKNTLNPIDDYRKNAVKNRLIIFLKNIITKVHLASISFLNGFTKAEHSLIESALPSGRW
jgi:hypothetical protein